MTEVEPSRLRGRWIFSALAVLAVSVIAGLFIGTVDLPTLEVGRAIIDRIPGVRLLSGLTITQEALFFDIRLPRVVLAGLVGGALALSGAAYQGVFRNPLVDPYLLGTAAGAGLGATLAIAYLPATSISVIGLDIGLLPIAAFAGALIAVMMAYGLGASTGVRSSATLMLAGVSVTAFLTAVQTFIQQRETETLQRVYSWILGALGTADWSSVGSVAPYVAVSSGVILAHGRLLDVLSVGDDEATSLGVRASRVRLTVALAASLAAAAAVAAAGLIGFVGLVVPHMVRRLTAGSYRVVLPLSLIGGAAFMILADLLARTVLAPAELPIGVVTAFIGAPFFAGLLRRSRRSAV
ncbi:MAG: iron ABC transporter permease [Corynebacteriales bacterium]|nr:iron ABC transporter permease [Mycobacteriales bacterium]